MRQQLIRDFNNILEVALKSNTKVPLLVFIFSDPMERSKSFLNKIFAKSVLEHPKTAQLTLNEVTERNITKVLQAIAASQGIYDD